MAVKELVLDPACVVASGNSRLVFDHPSHPDRLVKVMRADFVARIRRRARRLSLEGQFVDNAVTLKEVSEFLALQAKHPELLQHVPWIHGFVQTNLGLGVVSEKITCPDGSRAPNLLELTRAGAITERHRELTRALCDEIERGRIIVNGLNADNFVAAGPRDAPTHLVIVDGFGDPAVPPLQRLLPWYNRLRMRQGLADLRRLVGI